MPDFARTPGTLIRSYYPALNGLRGLAILMVFWNHYGKLLPHHLWSDQLWCGVDLFFVLSGFLITGILWDSREAPDYFRSFYLRRALRVFPVYYGFFALLFLLTPVLKLQYERSLWWNLLYLLNVVLAHPSLGSPSTFVVGAVHAFRCQVSIGPFWSLCVEEHFYIVWPLLVWWLRDRVRLMGLCAAIWLVTPFLRTWVALHNQELLLQRHFLYFVTYARWDTLFAGAFLALWLRGQPLSPRSVRRIAAWLIVPAATILVAGALTVGRRWAPDEVNPLLVTYGYSLVALVAMGILLLALDPTSALFRWFGNRHLSALGLISYGFYVFHYVMFEPLSHINDLWLWRWHLTLPAILVLFAATYALAWLSFRYYESAFLRLKDRFAPPRRHLSVPARA